MIFTCIAIIVALMEEDYYAETASYRAERYSRNKHMLEVHEEIVYEISLAYLTGIAVLCSKSLVLKAGNSEINLIMHTFGNEKLDKQT